MPPKVINSVFNFCSCSKHTSGCHGRLHLSFVYRSVLSEALANPASHNHSVDGALCEKKYRMWKIKSIAKTSSESTSSLVASQLGEVPLSVHGAMPKLRTLQRTVQRFRHVGGIPVLRANTRA